MTDPLSPSRSKTVLYDGECPVCGEIKDYVYSEGDPSEPSSDEAYCNVCLWTFVETAQHYPTLKSVNAYRRQQIASAKKWIKRLEKYEI